MDIETAKLNLEDAIWEKDVEKAKLALASGYDFGESQDPRQAPWVEEAATKGCAAIVEAMLDAGFNINALRLPEKSTAISTAIGCDHDEVVELLLRRGADVTLGRPLISALNPRKTPARRLRYVQLLVEHGVDVNQLFDLYGDPSNQFTALDWTTDPEVIEYLRARGAKTAAELKGGTSPAAPTDTTSADEVVRYFEENFGPVDKRSQIEIVPTGYPIAIHAIRPNGDRRHLTLFTTGLSNQPMRTPPGQEDFSFAELFIQLPGEWPYDTNCGPELAWVTEWLRRIAQHPHDNHTWLGGPITIIDNEAPHEPLGPGVRFTSWLLLAEKTLIRKDGVQVNLYRLTPLYCEERDLERRSGAAELLRAFDRASVPFIVDLNRRSVVSAR